MAYSTIIRKKCKCSPNCDKWPTLGFSGYFSNHSPQEIKDKKGTKNEVAKKNRNNRLALGRKLHEVQDNSDRINLNEWFKRIELKHSNGKGCYCMECGEWIPQMYIRHATAHLLPKKLFKSVSTHELNYLILGAGCGCHQKTDRLDKFSKMKIWPEALRRIRIMIPLLPFDELKYISSQYLTAIYPKTKTK